MNPWEQWDPLDPFAAHSDGRVVTRAEKEERTMRDASRNKRGVWVHNDQVQAVLDPKSWISALAAPFGGLVTVEAMSSPGYPRFRMYVQDAVWLDAVMEALSEPMDLPHGGEVRVWTQGSTDRLVRFIDLNDLAVLDSAFRLGGSPAVHNIMRLVVA